VPQNHQKGRDNEKEHPLGRDKESRAVYAGFGDVAVKVLLPQKMLHAALFLGFSSVVMPASAMVVYRRWLHWEELGFPESNMKHSGVGGELPKKVGKAGRAVEVRKPMGERNKGDIDAGKRPERKRQRRMTPAWTRQKKQRSVFGV
jgi:hypothetical protein